MRRRLLLAYALANAVLYSMLLPLWEGFDEPFHFGYVQYLANGIGLPDPRTSGLSQEVASSLLLAPGSLAVKRNIPEITSYPEIFGWPESARQQAHRRLWNIDTGLRWQQSDFSDYEALQAPLAYAVLTVPERALARMALPSRVLSLRIIAGTIGALLLLLGAERLAGQLGISGAHKEAAIFCTFSSQMLWATLSHVANDWLAVPLTLWLLVTVIDYGECPSVRRGMLAWSVLAMGLLTKAYFLAFLPLPASACIIRHKWRDLGIGLLFLAAFAAPWYVRNVERYGTISGMQELRQGTDPMLALQAIRITKVPAAFDGYARGALWTANNTFRSFSVKTLRAVIFAWLIALLLWAAARHRRAEWTVVFFCCLFILALAYDTGINYVASQHETASPGAWYTQVLLVPMLALGFLGTSRTGTAGRFVAVAMVLLFGYVLVATYWVKLIPLYSGFAGRTSLTGVTMLYRERLSTVMAGLDAVCLVPAAVILSMAGLVAVLAVVQQVVFIGGLLRGRISSAKLTCDGA